MAGLFLGIDFSKLKIPGYCSFILSALVELQNHRYLLGILPFKCLCSGNRTFLKLFRS